MERVDLRSDTVTRPSLAMREVMSAAPVGDDVYGDDPTANLLEERVAEVFGKEAAVFVPTGSLSNQLAIRVHARSGDRILLHEDAHILKNEGGAAASLSGVTCHSLRGDRGIFTRESVDEALPPLHRFTPSHLGSPARALCVENTHNGGGGAVWPLETLREVTDAAREHGLATHLDGARIWNAIESTGSDPLEIGRIFDTISVCFSKGLGAPVGSALLGSREHISAARRFKQLFGGGIRQAGILAAGALYALENNRGRLAEDHAWAKRFARGIALVPGILLDPQTVETNIVRFTLEGLVAGSFVEACEAEGVTMLASGSAGVRAVFHMDVGESGVERAIAVVSGVVGAAAVA